MIIKTVLIYIDFRVSSITTDESHSKEIDTLDRASERSTRPSIGTTVTSESARARRLGHHNWIEMLPL